MENAVRAAAVAVLIFAGGCRSFDGSQNSYYKALERYATNLHANGFNGDPDFNVVPITAAMYPIGTVLVNGNGVNECAIDPALIQTRPMAPQPPEVWSTSSSLAGTIPAAMLGGLANAGLNFKSGGTASLSMGQPLTQDEVLLDAFKEKVATDRACLARINNRKVDLVRGIIRAPEKWSWTAGTTVEATAGVGSASAGPSFKIGLGMGNVPVSIEEASPSPRFFVVTPIPAQEISVAPSVAPSVAAAPIPHPSPGDLSPGSIRGLPKASFRTGGQPDAVNLQTLSPR